MYSVLYQVGMLHNSPLDIHLDILRSLKKADSPLLPNIYSRWEVWRELCACSHECKQNYWCDWLPYFLQALLIFRAAHTRVVILQTTQVEARERSHCIYDSNLYLVWVLHTIRQIRFCFLMFSKSSVSSFLPQSISTIQCK